MSSAQAMQEELQQSIVLSEAEADYEEDDQDNMDVDRTIVADDGTDQDDTNAGHGRRSRGARRTRNVADEDSADVSEDQNTYEDAVDGDLSALEDEDHGDTDDDANDSTEEEDDGDASMGEGDAEGEDDDEPITQTQFSQDDEQDLEDEDEAEGVGAVKIRPGDTDEESNDSASVASGASSDHDSEDDWEGTARNKGENGDEDDESESADPNLCIFCKTAEENDPSEDFEAFLACSNCGDHGESLRDTRLEHGGHLLNKLPPAHQQCARDAAAISDQTGTLSVTQIACA